MYDTFGHMVLTLSPNFLKLRGAELVRSNSYAAGLTLRFPRVVAIRQDKMWQDCMTKSELDKLNLETQVSAPFYFSVWLFSVKLCD